MNRYFISLSIVSTCLLYSCNHRINQQNKKVLTSAEYLMNSKPDSAYLLLNTINIKKLNEFQYYCFITLKINVKDKLYLNAVEDTMVFQAMNYFLKSNNAKYKLLSCFVSAKVQEEQNNKEKAITHYLEAVKWIDKTSNFSVNGAIYYNLARLFHQINQYQQSLFYAENARKYYDLANCNYIITIYINELFAHNYLFLNSVDSSLLFFKSAENIAIRNKDIFNEQRIAQSMAVTYCDAKEFKIAKEKYRHALHLVIPSDSLNIGRLHLTLGAAFLGEDKIDSATISLHKAEKLLENSNNLIDLIDLNRLLSEVEGKNKNYEKALYYQTLSNTHSNFHKNAEKTVLKGLAKYQDDSFQTLQAERDKYAKERLYLYLVFLTLIILFGAFFYKNKENFRKLKRIFHTFKEKYDRVIEEHNKEIEKSGEEKAQMKAEFEKIVTELRNDFNLEQLLIVFHINNTAALDEILTARDIDTNYRKAQAQVKLLVQSITWSVVFNGLKNAHNGLADNLKADFPQLSEKEYRIRLLSCTGFTVMGIAKILKYAASTIQTDQTYIRKKIGIAPAGSFTTFVHKKYGITINR